MTNFDFSIPLALSSNAKVLESRPLTPSIDPWFDFDKINNLSVNILIMCLKMVASSLDKLK